MRAPVTTPAYGDGHRTLLAGAGDADRLMQAMASVLARQRPASAAEALKLLRRGYPEIPLAMRIAALQAGAK